MAEEKRTRRSRAEVKEEKKAQYLKAIEGHKAAIATLEQKIKDLDKAPKKTEAQIRKELMEALKGKSLEELAKAAGVKLED